MSYIDREQFIADMRTLYCFYCDKRRGMKNGKMQFCYDIGDAPCRACGIHDILTVLEDYKTAQRWIVR